KSACYYKQALDLYKGELLPDISTEIWVIEENLQLKMIFDTCVQRLADYFKRNGKDAELEALYEKAVRLFPYENWQLDQIDALLAKGENE
ncbi:bacterial transcriptional activator domain-containing protein, partial [Acinetobacter sp. 163]|nr:bacterial transcriptional activator domain-containing protein [Acinetobacter sp. 163]